MRRLLPTLLLVSLALPSVAGAHKPARHHRYHARPHVVRKAQRAHKADVTGCEYPGEPTWAEWRSEMGEAGFSPEETAELEICDES